MARHAQTSFRHRALVEQFTLFNLQPTMKHSDGSFFDHDSTGDTVVASRHVADRNRDLESLSGQR